VAALFCALGLLILGCDNPAQPDSDPDAVGIAFQEVAASTGKIQLLFDVRLPDPDHQDGFPPNRVLGGVKEKVLRALLNDLQHGMDQFQAFTPGSGPMDPPTLLDEAKTLAELGLSSGATVLIKSN
jgi:hypothetical protein